jgi:aromatic ring-opening dioxygenase catalytic subunit (LigB family)
MRQPTFYLTHGAGPCFWTDFPPPFGPHAYDGLAKYRAGLLDGLPERPRAILMVTAHWEEAVPTLSTSAAPPMLFDYHGFPENTYELSYLAPGTPQIAQRAIALLRASGIEAKENPTRGYDHGVFVPMLKIDPSAGLPIAMMSLDGRLDPMQHLAIGAALSPLRDEGVLIVGSGSSYHALRHVWDGDPAASIEFDDWLHDTVTCAPNERQARLSNWTMAPSGLRCHPRADHLLPLMVAAGAALDDPGQGTFREAIGGKVYSCFSFGEAGVD